MRAAKVNSIDNRQIIFKYKCNEEKKLKDKVAEGAGKQAISDGAGHALPISVDTARQGQPEQGRTRERQLHAGCAENTQSAERRQLGARGVDGERKEQEGIQDEPVDEDRQLLEEDYARRH